MRLVALFFHAWTEPYALFSPPVILSVTPRKIEARPIELLAIPYLGVADVKIDLFLERERRGSWPAPLGQKCLERRGVFDEAVGQRRTELGGVDVLPLRPPRAGFVGVPDEQGNVIGRPIFVDSGRPDVVSEGQATRPQVERV